MAKTCALHTSSLHTSPQDTSPPHTYTFALTPPLFAPLLSTLSERLSPSHLYSSRPCPSHLQVRQRRLRDVARRGLALRARDLLLHLRDARPKGGHGRIRRQGEAKLQERVRWPGPGGGARSGATRLAAAQVALALRWTWAPLAGRASEGDWSPVLTGEACEERCGGVAVRYVSNRRCFLSGLKYTYKKLVATREDRRFDRRGPGQALQASALDGADPRAVLAPVHPPPQRTELPPRQR